MIFEKYLPKHLCGISGFFSLNLLKKWQNKWNFNTNPEKTLN